LLRIGFRRFEIAEGGFGGASGTVKRGEIRIDCESGISCAERLVRAMGQHEVGGFRKIGPRVVGIERDGPVGLIDYFCLEVGLGACPSELVFGVIGRSLARERVGVVRVDLERLIE
jgi:hypothetical protein